MKGPTMYTTTTNDARSRRIKAERERENRLLAQGVKVLRPGTYVGPRPVTTK